MRNFYLLVVSALLISFTVAAQDPAIVTLEIVETPLTSGDLPFTASGQQVWGDYNNDGLLDFFQVSGQGTGAFSGLYKNNGNGTFTEVLTDITMLSLASAVFFDYDNDGNLDLLIAGSVDGTTTAALTELYRNSGAPDYTFVLNESATFVGISAEGGDNSSRLLEAVDYDNDGWTDVFMSGNSGSQWEVSGNSRVVALYRNNEGTFELQTKPVEGTENFVSMNGGGIHCGDVNRDGYIDMIVTGYVDGTVQTVTDLYLNKGDGTFKYFADSRTTFRGHCQGETIFADINNDGWLDIVEVGRDVNQGWASFANLYINNQDMTFTKSDGSVTGLVGGSAVIAAGDLNNDGWLDMVISGWGPNTTFFYNKGNNTFLVKAIDPDRARARAGNVNFVDFTKDGNLDFTIFGYRDGGGGTPENPTWPNFLLKNKLAEGIANNQAPSSPVNVLAKEQDGNVVLTWGKGNDDTTPADALRYNVYAKSKVDGKTFMFFPADAATGMLKAAVNGVRPLISGLTYTFKGFSLADYTFGVQSVDNAHTGSTFAIPSHETSARITQNDLDVMVFGKNGNIIITNRQSEPVSYKVISINGKNLMNGVCYGNDRLELPVTLKGLYVVQTMDMNRMKTDKVVIY